MVWGAEAAVEKKPPEPGLSDSFVEESKKRDICVTEKY